MTDPALKVTWAEAEQSWRDWLHDQRTTGRWKDSPDVMQFLDWAMKQFR